MHIKQLEIIGFKSFAKKATFDFHEGINTLVGPNGCGKSNVVDAIRWVLGESSARAIRGKEMAELIFYGSSKSKPIGMAEVSLTLTGCSNWLNLLSEDIKITRRLFRDGNSQFFLNNKKCRLREIHSLLSGTGIGINAYHIIEQGKIDILLSTSPHERRVFFEEISGISQFITQKKQSLVKLDKARINLDRITDLVKEIQSQLSRSKSKVEKAKRYQQIAHKYQIIDSHLAHRNWKKNETQQKIEEQKLEKLKDKEGELRILKENLEKEYEAQSKLCEELEQSLKNSEKKLSDDNNIIHSIKKQEEMNEVWLQESSLFQEKIEDEIVRLSEESKKFKDDEKDLREKKSNIQSILSKEEPKLSELKKIKEEIYKEKLDLEKRALSLQELQEKREFAKQSYYQKRQETTQKIEFQKLHIEENQRNFTEVSKYIEDIKEKILDFNSNLHIKKKDLDIKEKKLDNLKKKIDENKIEFTSSKEHLEKQRHDLLEAISKKKIIESHTLESHSLEESSTFFRENPYKNVFRISPFLEKLTIEKGYFKAIERALLGKLETILITSSEHEMLRNIGDISENLEGSYLLFQSLLPKKTYRKSLSLIPQEKDVKGLASDFVSVQSNKKLQEFISFLLDPILIVSNIKRGIEISEIWKGDIVTLHGDYLFKDGSILTGFKKQTKLEYHAGKKDEAKKLGFYIQKKEEDVEELTKHHNVLKENQSKEEAKMQECKILLGDLEMECQRISSEIVFFESKKREFSKKSEEFIKNQEIAKRKIEYLEKEIVELEKEQSSSFQSQSDTKNKLLEVLSKQKILAEKEQNLVHNILEVQSEIQVHKRIASEITDQKNSLKRRKKELQRSKKRQADEKDRIKEKIVTIEQKREEFSKLKENLKNEIDNIFSKIETLRKDLEKEHKKLLESEKKQRDIQSQAKSFHEKRDKIERILEKCSWEKERLYQDYEERNQLDISNFREDYPLLFTEMGEENDLSLIDDLEFWGRVERERAKLSREVPQSDFHDSIIEEYKEQEKRLDFLKKECEDVQNSSKKLEDSIAKMDGMMKKKFVKTFTAIQESFEEMTKSLLGSTAEGKILLDCPENPLESGIDIRMKPEGKKWQKIHLLSGGEKALTSLAILFSFFSVKPSSFVILDELDAPLDEHNIDKFANILEKFTEKIQFLIITHNRKTMIKADVLYGISMQNRKGFKH